MTSTEATEATGSTIVVHTINGRPSFAAATRLEQEMRTAAGVGGVGDRLRPVRRSPTAFHVATRSTGQTMGVAATATGPFAELPVGLALARVGLEAPNPFQVPDPTCELVGFAVDETSDTEGVAELLYRAFYRHACRSGARSLAISIDGWMLDIFRDDYGVPFDVLGPPVELLGRELLPVGGAIDALVAALAEANPTFHAFLTAS